MRELAPGTDRWGADVTADGRGPLDVHASRPGATRSPPGATTPAIKIPAGHRHRAGPGGGRRPVRAGRRRRARRGPAREVAARRRATRCATTARPAAARLAAALTPEVDAVLARHPLRELVTAVRAAAAAGGAGAGPVRLLVRVLPALARATVAGAAPVTARSAPPPSGCPRSPRWASTSSTCRPIHPIGTTFRKGPQQHPVRRPGRRRRAVGDRLPGGRPRRRPPASWARSRTSTASWRRARDLRHGDRPGLRAPVLPRPPLGAQAPGVVPPPPRRHDRVRGEPAEEVPGHLPDRLRRRHARPGRARPCGSCGTGWTTACGSSASTTRTPSRSSSGSRSSPTSTAPTRTSSSWPRRSPARR